MMNITKTMMRKELLNMEVTWHTNIRNGVEVEEEVEEEVEDQQPTNTDDELQDN